jgi:hypothetical protein
MSRWGGDEHDERCLLLGRRRGGAVLLLQVGRLILLTIGRGSTVPGVTP